jgi:hypothetical protein
VELVDLVDNFWKSHYYWGSGASSGWGPGKGPADGNGLLGILGLITCGWISNESGAPSSGETLASFGEPGLTRRGCQLTKQELTKLKFSVAACRLAPARILIRATRAEPRALSGQAPPARAPEVASPIVDAPSTASIAGFPLSRPTAKPAVAPRLHLDFSPGALVGSPEFTTPPPPKVISVVLVDAKQPERWVP